MNARRERLISLLSLPASSQVGQRVPKKMLLENGAPTAADKRLINEAAEEIQWIAALKPNTVGVPDYRDQHREYLEIAVLAVTLRGKIKPANASRLAELIHRAVPYPVLLLLDVGEELIISLAHKRWAQNEAGKVVLGGDVVVVALTGTISSTIELAFLQSLSLTLQPQHSLLALYQGWIDCLYALLAAQLTGTYQLGVVTPEQSTLRRQALLDCTKFESEISRLQAQAAKEKQLARQVEVNLAIKRVQEKLATARQQL